MQIRQVTFPRAAFLTAQTGQILFFLSFALRFLAYSRLYSAELLAMPRILSH